MSKFIPAPDLINGTQKKRARRSFSDQKSNLFSELKKAVKESYASDAFAGVGNMQAIVLEKIDAGDPSKQAWKNTLTAYSFFVKNKVPDFIEIRYRVPELHAHLPEPKDANDFLAINLHPTAIIKKDKGIPEVGDIVTLDFADKVNFTGAIVVETFNSEKPPNAGGGICTAAGTFNSANAPLNVAASSGGSTSPNSSEQGAKSNPASEAFENGILYPNSQEIIDSWDPLTGNSTKRAFKRAIYNISIDNFNKIEDFTQSEKDLHLKLARKNVFSVCFTIADRGRFIKDRARLSRIVKKLYEHNIDVSFLIRTKNKEFNKSIIELSKIVKTSPETKNIFFELFDQYTEDEMVRMDAALRNLSDSAGCNYAVIIKEGYLDTAMPSLQDYTFLADNKYDYSKREETVTQTTADAATARDLLSSQFAVQFPMYYLGGINFIQTPNEPCVAGKRSADILEREIQEHAWGSGDESMYFFDMYEYLSEGISSIIAKKVSGWADGFPFQYKQSLLNSRFTTEQPQLSNVAGVTPSVAPTTGKEQPTFNSEPTGSQDVSPSAPAPFNAAPGAQCPPQAGGAIPAGEYNGPPGPAVQAPSFRFDSIEDYANLGWTADPGSAINNVIFEFMEKFSAALYRIIPATDPIITNSYHKKIRVTSTARTYEKQAYLMWDKVRQGGDSAVYKLYGEKTWTRAVVNAYHAGGRPQNAASMYSNPQFATAVEAVRVRVEVDGGGSAHLKGRGVDIHTWSHIKAEGVANAQSATEAQMNATRYVQAIIAACAEAGGKPTVEAYQQHVHITIL